MRLLLDQNLPRALGSLLAGHNVVSAADMGWGELSNGELLSAAEIAGFAAMLTADQNIRYQQNLKDRRLALVVLSTNTGRHSKLVLTASSRRSPALARGAMSQ